MSDKGLRMLRSWWWSPEETAVEFHNVATGRRLRLATDRVGDVAVALTALADGIPGDGAPAILSTVSGLDSGDCEALLGSLRAAGVVVEAPYDDSFLLEDRQEAFFGMLETPEMLAPEANRRLRASTVSMVGLGGYGSWLAALMVRLGVRELRVVDGDVVEERNLSRQVLYTMDDIGDLKADAARRALEAVGRTRVVSFAMSVDEPSQIEDVIRGSDLILSEWSWSAVAGLGDAASLGRILLDLAVRLDVPILSYSGNVVGPLTRPAVDACPLCVAASGEEFGAGRAVRAMQRSGAPSISSRLALTSAAVAWEAMLFLSGLGCSSASAVIHLSPFEWTASVQRFARRADCPVCGGAAG